MVCIKSSTLDNGQDLASSTPSSRCRGKIAHSNWLCRQSALNRFHGNSAPDHNNGSWIILSEEEEHSVGFVEAGFASG